MARLKVTDDDYDLLTEEERVGLKEFQAELDAEADAEDAEIAAAAAGDPEEPAKTEDKPDPEPEEEPDDEPEADDEEEPPGEGEPEAGEEAEEDEEEAGDEEEAPAAPIVTAPPVNKLSDAEEARLKAIKTELNEIAKQFDDGELTAQEMRDKQEVLLDERDALKEKKTLAAMSEQNAINVWYYNTIPTFMATHTEYKEGSLRHKLLDTLVRDAQAGAKNPTDPKILFDAHAKVVAEFGEAKGAEKPAKAKKKPNGNGQKRETPPNFSAIPASDAQQVVPTNKFARLDKLKGVDYEKALAKLTPADREFYLQGG